MEKGKSKKWFSVILSQLQSGLEEEISRLTNHSTKVTILLLSREEGRGYWTVNYTCTNSFISTLEWLSQIIDSKTFKQLF